MAWATWSAGQAHGKAGEIEVMPTVALADVAGIELPRAMRVVSTTAEVRRGPTSDDPVLTRLPFGTTVSGLEFVTGEDRHNDCRAAPYDGCIGDSNVWVRIRAPSLGASHGFCSLLSLRDLPSFAGEPGELKFDDVFKLPRLGAHGSLYGQDVPAWQLPPAAPVSFVDELGWSHLLAKNVIDSGRLVASRKEIEFYVRRGASGARFEYVGAPRRVPNYWHMLPPLIQPVKVSPGIDVLIIYERHARLAKISLLGAARYFTYSSELEGDAVPLVFKRRPELRNAVGLVLLSEQAARRLRAQRIVVHTRRALQHLEDARALDIVTTVDLDGDRQPEIVRFATKGRRKTSCEDFGDCRWAASQVAMLHDGVWFVTASMAQGQDGLEGF